MHKQLKLKTYMQFNKHNEPLTDRDDNLRRRMSIFILL